MMLQDLHGQEMILPVKVLKKTELCNNAFMNNGAGLQAGIVKNMTEVATDAMQNKIPE